MELSVKGTAKEIADLVLALQGRQFQETFQRSNCSCQAKHEEAVKRFIQEMTSFVHTHRTW